MRVTSFRERVDDILFVRHLKVFQYKKVHYIFVECGAFNLTYSYLICFSLLYIAKGYGCESNLMSCMMQVNCVILTHHIVHGRSTRKRIAMIDVFDCLSSMKFVPVGMKMVLFTKDQVNQLLWLMKSRSADNKQNLVREVCVIPIKELY